MRNFKATTEQEYVRATGRLNNFTKVAEVKLAASKKVVASSLGGTCRERWEEECGNRLVFRE